MSLYVCNTKEDVMEKEVSTQTPLTELLAALSKAQGEMSPAVMDKKSTAFGGRAYPYASLSSILRAVRPAFSKHGLAVVQKVESVNGELCLKTTLGHSSGQWIDSVMPLMIDKKTSQGLGSAITYARRYSLAAFAGVETDADDDGLTAEEAHENVAGLPVSAKLSTHVASVLPAPVKSNLATIEQRASVMTSLTETLGFNKQMATAWLQDNSPKPKSSDWTTQDIELLKAKITALRNDELGFTS